MWRFISLGTAFFPGDSGSQRPEDELAASNPLHETKKNGQGWYFHRVMLWSIAVKAQMHIHTFMDSGPLIFFSTLIELISELLMLVSGVATELPDAIELSGGKNISRNDAFNKNDCLCFCIFLWHFMFYYVCLLCSVLRVPVFQTSVILIWSE